MMFAGCCNCSQIKYIDKDGKVDQKRYKAAMRWAGIKRADPAEPVCRCECHQDGQRVLC